MRAYVGTCTLASDVSACVLLIDSASPCNLLAHVCETLFFLQSEFGSTFVMLASCSTISHILRARECRPRWLNHSVVRSLVVGVDGRRVFVAEGRAYREQGKLAI